MPTDATLLSVGIEMRGGKEASVTLEELEERARAADEALTRLHDPSKRPPIKASEYAEVERALRAEVDAANRAVEAEKERIAVNDAWINQQALAAAALGKSRTEIVALEGATRNLTKMQQEQLDTIVKYREQHDMATDAMGRMRGGAMALGISVAAWTEAIRRAIDYITQLVRAFLTWEEAQSRMNAMLNVAGDRIGRTKDQVNEMIAAISRGTGESQTSLTNAASALLKFAGVTGETFDRALKLSSDLAAFMGTEAPHAAELLGRAMENSYGAMMLRRVGLVTDAEYEFLKALRDVAGEAVYHERVLSLLEDRIGGVGKVIAEEGLAGAWRQFSSELAASVRDFTAWSLEATKVEEIIRALRGALVVLREQGLAALVPVAAEQQIKSLHTTFENLNALLGRQMKATLAEFVNTLRVLSGDTSAEEWILQLSLALATFMEGLANTLKWVQDFALGVNWARDTLKAWAAALVVSAEAGKLLTSPLTFSIDKLKAAWADLKGAKREQEAAAQDFVKGWADAMKGVGTATSDMIRKQLEEVRAGNARLRATVGAQPGEKVWMEPPPAALITAQKELEDGIKRRTAAMREATDAEKAQMKEETDSLEFAKKMNAQRQADIDQVKNLEDAYNIAFRKFMALPEEAKKAEQAIYGINGALASEDEVILRWTEQLASHIKKVGDAGGEAKAVLDEQLAKLRAEVASDKETYDARIRMLDDMHKKEGLSEAAYYAGRAAAREEYLAAEKRFYDAQVAAIQGYGAKNAAEQARINKQLIDAKAAYDKIVDAMTGADVKDAVDAWKMVGDQIEKTKDVEIKAVDDQIKKLEEYIAVIGKTKEQIAQQKEAADTAYIDQLRQRRAAIAEVLEQASITPEQIATAPQLDRGVLADLAKGKTTLKELADGFLDLAQTSGGASSEVTTALASILNAIDKLLPKKEQLRDLQAVMGSLEIVAEGDKQVAALEKQTKTFNERVAAIGKSQTALLAYQSALAATAAAEAQATLQTDLHAEAEAEAAGNMEGMLKAMRTLQDDYAKVTATGNILVATLKATGAAADADAAALNDHAKTLGMTKEQLLKYRQAQLDTTIATLEAAKARLNEMNPTYEAEREEIDKTIAKLKGLQEAEGKAAAAESANQFREEWKSMFGSIDSGLADAIMNGFEHGKNFADEFINTLKDMFKNLVLRPIIQFVMAPIAGALTNLFSGMIPGFGTGGQALLNAGQGVGGNWMSNFLFGSPSQSGGFNLLRPSTWTQPYTGSLGWLNRAGSPYYNFATGPGASFGLSTISQLPNVALGSAESSLFAAGEIGAGAGTTSAVAGLTNIGAMLPGMATAALIALPFISGLFDKEPSKVRGQFAIRPSGTTTGWEDSAYYQSHYGWMGFLDEATQQFSGEAGKAFSKIISDGLDVFETRFSKQNKEHLAEVLQGMVFPSVEGEYTTEDFIKKYGMQVAKPVFAAAMDEIDTALGTALRAFQGENVEEIITYTNTLLQIYDVTKLLNAEDHKRIDAMLDGTQASADLALAYAGVYQVTETLTKVHRDLVEAMLDETQAGATLAMSFGKAFASVEGIQRRIGAINQYNPAADWARVTGGPLSYIPPLPGTTRVAPAGFGEPSLGEDVDRLLAGTSPYSTFIDAAKGLRDLMDAFKGTQEQTDALTAATQAYYAAGVELLAQYTALKDAIDGMFLSTEEQIRLSGLSKQAQYDYWREQADIAREAMLAATDPAEIERQARRANQAIGNAWGLLSDTQQNQAREGFLAYLEDIRERSGEHLTDLGETVTGAIEDTMDDVDQVLRGAAQSFGKAADDSAKAADKIDKAADKMVDAGVNMATASTTPITVVLVDSRGNEIH